MLWNFSDSGQSCIVTFISNYISKTTSGKMLCFGKGFKSFGGMPLCWMGMAGSCASDLRKGTQNFCITHEYKWGVTKSYSLSMFILLVFQNFLLFCLLFVEILAEMWYRFCFYTTFQLNYFNNFVNRIEIAVIFPTVGINYLTVIEFMKVRV